VSRRSRGRYARDRRRGLRIPVLVSTVMTLLAGSIYAGQAASAGVPAGVQLTRSSQIVVTKPGTVIDALEVHGYILIKADNVTIKRTRVVYGGYHSIRVFSGVRGTIVEDSEVLCQDSSKTNGLVFGSYTALRVEAAGCRHSFMYAPNLPALIVDSFADDEPVNVVPGVERTVDSSTSPAPPAPTSSGTPSPSAPQTSVSSPTITPTSSPTPSPSAPRSTAQTTPRPGPVFEGYPDDRSTGVPEGTQLTPSSSLTITKDGTTVDSLHIKGTVTVRANNVTIKRSLIDNTGLYPIQIDSGYRNLVIEDVEIDGNGNGEAGRASTAILRGDYTLRRVDIHSVIDGPRIEGDNVVIEDSYVHDLSRIPGGHHDTIQIRKGSNIVIRHNTLLAYNAQTGDEMNAAIQIGSLTGPLDNLLVDGNMMNGGNYTVNAGKASGSPIYFRNNVFGRDFRYGVLSDGPGVNWDSSNVWLDNGQPAN